MAGARPWDFESLHEKVDFFLRSLGSSLFVKAPFWAAAGAASSLGWGHTHTPRAEIYTRQTLLMYGLLARSVWAPGQGL